MCRHALEDENDLRLPNALAANELLRTKLAEALQANVTLRGELAQQQVITILQPVHSPDPALVAIRKRLEDARDHGGMLARRFARQMLGEAR